MPRFSSLSIAAILLCGTLLCGTIRAADKGGMAFILDHAKELQLNDDQKKKLNNLRSQEERTRIKLLAETDMKVLIHKTIQAKLKNDEAATQEAYAELVKKLIEKSAPVAKSMMDDMAKILTPEQILKINALKEAEDGKTKPGNPKPDEKNKPKRGTEPPNPFEF
jgi:Spy/CpxP family protein refolding chaperone